MTKDVVILGSGPAGISAAVYAARAGLSVQVIGKSNGSLWKAEKIENYYGFAKPISGEDLMSAGVEQARRLGVEVLEGEALGLTYEADGFGVSTVSAEFRAPSVILATGSQRKTPKIPGLAELEGKGVSYCAVCDAFFYRGKDVAVLGDGIYALHEAAELVPVVGTVTLITDGKEPPADVPGHLRVVTAKITELNGSDRLESIRFEDGSELAVNGVFVALGVAGSGDFAKKLGAELKGNSIVADSAMKTNVPGLFAAGDCTGGLMQVAKAVYEGMVAATSAVKYLRELKHATALS